MANNRHQPAHPRASVRHCSDGDFFPQFSSGKQRDGAGQMGTEYPRDNGLHPPFSLSVHGQWGEIGVRPAAMLAQTTTERNGNPLWPSSPLGWHLSGSGHVLMQWDVALG